MDKKKSLNNNCKHSEGIVVFPVHQTRLFIRTNDLVILQVTLWGGLFITPTSPFEKLKPREARSVVQGVKGDGPSIPRLAFPYPALSPNNSAILS